MKIALCFLVAVLIATAGVYVDGSSTDEPGTTEAIKSPGGTTVQEPQAPAETVPVVVENTTAGAVMIRSSWSVAVMVVSVAACLRLSM